MATLEEREAALDAKEKELAHAEAILDAADAGDFKPWVESFARRRAAERAAAAEPADEASVDCPECQGAGEHCYEPPGWWHGSGVMVECTPCSGCRGTGAIYKAEAAQIEAERARDAALAYADRLRHAQAREEWADSDPWANPTAPGWSTEVPF